jgi:hypothetical protein
MQIVYQHCGKEKLQGITGSKCCNQTATSNECEERGYGFRECAGFA